MWGRSRKKLLRNGVEATGVVMKVDRVTGQSQADYHMRLDFPDGDHAEWKQTCWFSDIGRIVVTGDELPVRYDAEDRSRATIDTVKTAAAVAARAGAREREALEHSRALGEHNG